MLPAGPAVCADPGSEPRKDAAESVQEGNVQQWIEYYQRSRPSAPVKPPAPPAPAPQTATPPAAPPPK